MASVQVCQSKSSRVVGLLTFSTRYEAYANCGCNVVDRVSYRILLAVTATTTSTHNTTHGWTAMKQRYECGSKERTEPGLDESVVV